MKKVFFALLGIAFCAWIMQSCVRYERMYLLVGASFAVSENGWFEIACDTLQVKPLNRSVKGKSIIHTASKMYKGSLYSKKELKKIDAFIIMHVHNQNVAETKHLKTDYTQYTYEEITSDYSVAYDYVIKRYQADCRQQKKEPRIILCTHWHDARSVYNTSIRILADRWHFPLIKWDEKIGFTKTILDPDGLQPSLKFANDTEDINGVLYGWHPFPGKKQEIQRRMAQIFYSSL